jgi:hypothetical protein
MHINFYARPILSTRLAGDILAPDLFVLPVTGVGDLVLAAHPAPADERLEKERVSINIWSAFYFTMRRFGRVCVLSSVGQPGKKTALIRHFEIAVRLFPQRAAH